MNALVERLLVLADAMNIKSRELTAAGKRPDFFVAQERSLRAFAARIEMKVRDAE